MQLAAAIWRLFSFLGSLKGSKTQVTSKERSVIFLSGNPLLFVFLPTCRLFLATFWPWFFDNQDVTGSETRRACRIVMARHRHFLRI